MTPDGVLPRELAALVEAELRPGERIVWVGQPIPRRFAGTNLAIFLFGIPWTAFAIFWTIGAYIMTSDTSADSEGAGLVQLFRLFPLLGLPFVLVGIAMLSCPFLKRREARRTAYVITDQRALIFAAVGWRGNAMRSFEPERLKDLNRVQHSDGSGDIIFDRQWTPDSDGGKLSSDIGFIAIADVKTVEDHLRALVARKNPRNT